MDEEATETHLYGKVWILGGFSAPGGGLIGLLLSGGKVVCCEMLRCVPPKVLAEKGRFSLFPGDRSFTIFMYGLIRSSALPDPLLV